MKWYFILLMGLSIISCNQPEQKDDEVSNCGAYYHLCDTNSVICCPDTVNYFPMRIGNRWRYKCTKWFAGQSGTDSISAFESWTITSITDDRSGCTIETFYSGAEVTQHLNPGANPEFGKPVVVPGDTVHSFYTISFLDSTFHLIASGPYSPDAIDIFSTKLARPKVVREYAGEILDEVVYSRGENTTYNLQIGRGFNHIRYSFSDIYGSSYYDLELIEFIESTDS